LESTEEILELRQHTAEKNTSHKNVDVFESENNISA